LSSLNEGDTLLAQTSVRGVELEGPEEVVGLTEVLSDSDNLMNQILNADNSVLSESLLNDRVLRDGNALTSNLSETTLVDQFLDGLEVGLSVCDVRSNNAEHLKRSRVNLDENSVVDSAKTQKLEDLAGLGVNSVDTTNADNKVDLGIGLSK